MSQTEHGKMRERDRKVKNYSQVVYQDDTSSKRKSPSSSTKKTEVARVNMTN